MNRMTVQPRHVLVLGADQPAVDRVAPLLRREEFDVHTMAPSRWVFDVVSGTPFELLIITYPLPELPLLDLLAAVRGSESSCRRAGVLLVADPTCLDGAQSFVDRGVNRVVSLDWPESRIWQAFSDLLSVAPRVSLRVLLEAKLRVNGDSPALCQTNNISATGMLVRSDIAIPIGSRFDFTFFIRGQTSPVRGSAEVVRRTPGEQEEPDAFGARFIAVRPDGEERLRRYINEQLR